MTENSRSVLIIGRVPNQDSLAGVELDKQAPISDIIEEMSSKVKITPSSSMKFIENDQKAVFSLKRLPFYFKKLVFIQIPFL